MKESDFKSDVSTNFTKRAFNLIFKAKNIPQFDLLTLGAQIFGLLISLYFFYSYSISTSIANFIEVKKFRTKKLTKNNLIVNNVEKDLTSNLWLISYSYINFLK